MLLRIKNLRVAYGNVEALHGVDIEVREGEIVAILGANGAGKSTTLRAISGLHRPKSGEILFAGQPLHSLPSHEIVMRGVVQAPEGRRVFATLTVGENLEMGAFVCKDKKTVASRLKKVLDLFPRLGERREQLAGTLSGGEQQMLAIGRALMSGPRLLLLDEPSLGLAPIMIKPIFSTIKAINQAGVTVLLVEQSAFVALKVAHRAYVLDVGKVVMSGSGANLLKDPEVQKTYLGGGRK
ncbi:MAG: ABC transporter ATP-binding protein [Desulfarculales bacterium]|jgi:branched-chain amino acid transport system ATP-binding protein|nr:ABC transporter ATP-binding protein [Desulfarculales bacterium]